MSAPEQPEKTYLGDSVYAEFDGFSIVLTTENGYGPSNTIALEPWVMQHLANYAKRIDALRDEMRQRNALPEL